MKKDRDHIYFGATRGMCRECRELVNAQILLRDDGVFLRKYCPEHGHSEALIAKSVDWYLKVMASPQAGIPPRTFANKIANGCPYDCGLCTWHEQSCNLPVFSITNACNMACPICFTYNRKDKLYFMPPDEFRNIVDLIVKSEGELDLINITGGEPALHPGILELLKICQRPEIGRITMNSNGITLAEDESFVEKLAELGVYVILSFNTFQSEISRKIHGRDVVSLKLKALENLAKYDVQATLLNVMIKGVNDSEIGQVMGLAMESDNIRSVTTQNMTYTGQGGGDFYPRAHLTIDEAIACIEEQTDGLVKQTDFVPLPTAHPLCYSVTYLLKLDNGSAIPIIRFVDEDRYLELLREGYLIRPGGEFEMYLKEIIDNLWASGERIPESAEILKTLKKLLQKLYPIEEVISPFQRQKLAEKSVKTIFIHAHMDEDNFDLSRIVKCSDQVPQTDGRFIPACAYNLFYRMKDERFWIE